MIRSCLARWFRLEMEPFQLAPMGLMHIAMILGVDLLTQMQLSLREMTHQQLLELLAAIAEVDYQIGIYQPLMN